MAKLKPSIAPIVDTPKLPRKPRKPQSTEISDQDALWKEFLSQYFEKAMLLLHPVLWSAVDWTVPPEFLEQELLNSLRGRFKTKGKVKLTDKFVKLRLKSGKDCYVFVHFEVQGDLQDTFPKRLFTYRSLIFLRYDLENVTTIVLFTGEKPEEKHKQYFTECFGTDVTFNFNYCVLLEEDEEFLLNSDNPLAIAMLAGKYTQETKTDVPQRLAFKKKLFELVEKKPFSAEELLDVLNFVYDYMVLPTQIDNEFKAMMPNFSPLKSNPMVKTKGSQIVGDMFFTRAYGKPSGEWMADRIAEIQTKVEAEVQAERKKAIHGMLEEGFSIEKIAHILDYDLAFVQKVAQEFSTK